MLCPSLLLGLYYEFTLVNIYYATMQITNFYTENAMRITNF